MLNIKLACVVNKKYHNRIHIIMKNPYYSEIARNISDFITNAYSNSHYNLEFGRVCRAYVYEAYRLCDGKTYTNKFLTYVRAKLINDVQSITEFEYCFDDEKYPELMLKLWKLAIECEPRSIFLYKTNTFPAQRYSKLHSWNSKIWRANEINSDVSIKDKLSNQLQRKPPTELMSLALKYDYRIIENLEVPALEYDNIIQLMNLIQPDQIHNHKINIPSYKNLHKVLMDHLDKLTDHVDVNFPEGRDRLDKYRETIKNSIRDGIINGFPIA
jgi:hypothetical protein